MRLPIPFTGPTYTARSTHVNPQKTVNLYPEVAGPGAKNQIILYSTPGLTLRGTGGVGPIRSDFVEFKSKDYFVSKDELYSIDASNLITKIGTINTQSGRVSMVAGRDHLMLVDGTDGWTWDDTTFAQITDPDFPAGATHCIYVDGFFLVNKGGSDEVYKSASEDPTSWAALDFTVAEGRPDDVTALGTIHGDWYALGTKGAEVFYNSGNADFPFERYPNGRLDWAIDAPHSIARGAGGYMFWLARSEQGGVQPVMARGLSVQPIGNAALDWQIGQLSQTNDATGFVHADQGHTFYVLSFPNADKTFVIEPQTGLWHERKSISIGRWRVAGHGYRNGRHLVGDYANGRVYEFDYTKFTENGDTIERIRRFPILHKDRRPLFMARLEVEFEPGVGTASGSGSDPQAQLRLSRDGGKTWGNWMTTDIGLQGEYRRRAVWTKLGWAHQFIAEVKVTDPVDVTMIQAYADVEVGD